MILHLALCRTSTLDAARTLRSIGLRPRRKHSAGGRLTDANSASLHRQMVPLRSLRLPAGASRPGTHRFHAPDSTGSFAVLGKLTGLGSHGAQTMRLYGEHRASNFGCFPQRGLDYAARPSLMLSRMVQSAFGVLDSAPVLAGFGVLPFGEKQPGFGGKEDTAGFRAAHSIPSRTTS
jgi:hypothetical protein